MRYLWIAVTALALAACGEVEDTETQSYEERVIDLRVADQSHSVSVDGASDVTVIRRDGQKVPLPDWMADLGQRHGINLHDRVDPNRGRLTIRVGDADNIGSERERPESDPGAGLRADDNAAAACPETCQHCPEDNAFLCAQLCR